MASDHDSAASSLLLLAASAASLPRSLVIPPNTSAASTPYPQPIPPAPQQQLQQQQHFPQPAFHHQPPPPTTPPQAQAQYNNTTPHYHSLPPSPHSSHQPQYVSPIQQTAVMSSPQQQQLQLHPHQQYQLPPLQFHYTQAPVHFTSPSPQYQTPTTPVVYPTTMLSPVPAAAPRTPQIETLSPNIRPSTLLSPIKPRPLAAMPSSPLAKSPIVTSQQPKSRSPSQQLDSAPILQATPTTPVPKPSVLSALHEIGAVDTKPADPEPEPETQPISEPQITKENASVDKGSSDSSQDQMEVDAPTDQPSETHDKVHEAKNEEGKDTYAVASVDTLELKENPDVEDKKLVEDTDMDASDKENLKEAVHGEGITAGSTEKDAVAVDAGQTAPSIPEKATRQDDKPPELTNQKPTEEPPPEVSTPKDQTTDDTTPQTKAHSVSFSQPLPTPQQAQPLPSWGPGHPTPDGSGMNPSDLRSCRSILQSLMRHPSAWPFLHPVDPVAAMAPDYFEVITKPMDLSTICKKLALTHSVSSSPSADSRKRKVPAKTASSASLSGVSPSPQPLDDSSSMTDSPNRKSVFSVEASSPAPDTVSTPTTSGGPATPFTPIVSYPSVQAFAADVRLMLDNCFLYNPPENNIHQVGRQLEVHLISITMRSFPLFPEWINGDGKAEEAARLQMEERGRRSRSQGTSGSANDRSASVSSSGPEDLHQGGGLLAAHRPTRERRPKKMFEPTDTPRANSIGGHVPALPVAIVPSQQPAIPVTQHRLSNPNIFAALPPSSHSLPNSLHQRVRTNSSSGAPVFGLPGYSQPWPFYLNTSAAATTHSSVSGSGAVTPPIAPVFPPPPPPPPHQITPANVLPVFPALKISGLLEVVEKSCGGGRASELKAQLESLTANILELQEKTVAIRAQEIAMERQRLASGVSAAGGTGGGAGVVRDREERMRQRRRKEKRREREMRKAGLGVGEKGRGGDGAGSDTGSELDSDSGMSDSDDGGLGKDGVSPKKAANGHTKNSDLHGGGVSTTPRVVKPVQVKRARSTIDAAGGDGSTPQPKRRKQNPVSNTNLFKPNAHPFPAGPVYIRQSSFHGGPSSPHTSGGGRCCEYCGATQTPMWRKGPSGKGSLCNRCGVKWRHGKLQFEILPDGAELPPNGVMSPGTVVQLPSGTSNVSSAGAGGAMEVGGGATSSPMAMEMEVGDEASPSTSQPQHKDEQQHNNKLLSKTEKRQLSEAIATLSEEHQLSILQLVQESQGFDGDASGEVELDLDTLPPFVVTKLMDHVRQCVDEERQARDGGAE